MASRICGAAPQASPPPELLPVRRVLIHMRWLADFRQFVIFSTFFALYVTLCTVRIDWWHGRRTLVWFSQAHEAVSLQALETAETAAAASHMLEAGLPSAIQRLHHICSTCNVGLTTAQKDLAFVDLQDFVCSDFDSQIGVQKYPDRDCIQEDAQWAASPQASTAPCCQNATLVKASIAMMTEKQVAEAIQVEGSGYEV